jgi:predicted KAP-like P-loop ATPase
MRILDDLVEIEIGNSPDNYDVAIVSISDEGSLGELNQLPLNAFGSDAIILESLELGKGFDIYIHNEKIIIFIVTIGYGNPLNNLNTNLKAAISIYFPKIANKKIWLPIMGTGRAGLNFEESYLIIFNILESLKSFIIKYKCQFTISLPKTKNGLLLHKNISNKNFKLPKKDFLTYVKNKLKTIQSKFNVTFYLVGTHWENIDQAERFYGEQIWENGYENGSFYEIVNEIKIGDVLIVKSIFAKGIKSYLRIKAFGIVLENVNNGRELKVNWINVLEEAYDIEGLGHYRNTIATIKNEDLLTILSGMDTEIFEDLFKGIQNNKVRTTIPGLIADTDNGEDYLDIKDDINAFARVMAAKSFEPPLAIALLGKWGSGKSFFMRKLKEGIQTLSNENPEEQFCEGIAHVHFNAWSYMDSNLWACFVTRIFESLDDYIKDTFPTEKEKKEIENQLFNKLNVSKEQLNNLNKQKESIDNNIQKLQTKKDKLKVQLDGKIKSIKTKTLTDIIKKVDEEFKVRNEIENTLAANPTFVGTKEKFVKIVPDKYWDNPTAFYNQLKSGYTFLKAFFHRDSICKNILWITVIILILALTPAITSIINLLISWQDFTLTNGQWFTISLIGSTFVRGIDTFIKLKKQIAPFWKIKENYEAKKANALFEFEQEEKGLRLEIDNFKQEIIQIDSQIQLNKEIKATLEFKLKNALSTEALYTFIEKRANSDDYKKHLGIVSLIRKDFEILSGLLTGHQTELVTNKESQDFKELFVDKKPLERIILYIDDLDRCPEERVVEVLEAVNLLMAFPLFVVVVGVDPRWVKSALLQKYKNQFKDGTDDDEAISPSNYLEKIFQVPFHLKDAGDESIKGMIKTLAKNKVRLVISKVENDYDSNDYDSQEYKTNNLENDISVKNEEKTITDSTSLFSKETIEALDITDIECELLQSMSEIIGTNPRAVKRFVNIYRIVKTHEEFNFNNATKEAELSVVMFLLALPMGKFKNLIDSFESFVGEETIAFETLNDYVNPTPSIGGKKNEDLIKRKNELKIILQNSGIKTSEMDVDLFRKYNPFIKRFTFKNI